MGKRFVAVKGRRGFQRQNATLAKHEDYVIAKRIPPAAQPMWIMYFGKPLKVCRP